MSSIILHLCISKYLKQTNNFSDDFLVGSIAPDIYKKYMKDRNSTHYIKKIIYDNGKLKKIPDVDKFLKENKNKKDDYTLGYLSHLIQDKIWFDKYIPLYAEVISENEDKLIFVKDNSIHDSKDFSKEMYMDYSIIDRYILNKIDVDINEVKKIAKKYFNNDEINKIIDNEIRLYDEIPDREKYFLTNKDINKYFDECIEECNKIINILYQ